MDLPLTSSPTRVLPSLVAAATAALLLMMADTRARSRDTPISCVNKANERANGQIKKVQDKEVPRENELGLSIEALANGFERLTHKIVDPTLVTVVTNNRSLSFRFYWFAI